MLQQMAKTLEPHRAGLLAYYDYPIRTCPLEGTNNKIKTIDLKNYEVKTFLGGEAKKGEEPLFNEPAGLHVAGDRLYVADTNAHRIRIVDLKTKEVSTLNLTGVEPVMLSKE